MDFWVLVAYITIKKAGPDEKGVCKCIEHIFTIAQKQFQSAQP